MDLKDFYRLFLRNLWIVGISVLLGIATSLGITFTTTKQYTASAQLFVSTPTQTLDIGLLGTGANFTDNRVKSYANIVNGPDTLKPVIELLELNVLWNDLAKQVKATAPLDTSLINLSVTDSNPELAAALANAIGKQFETTAALIELKDTAGQSPVKVSLAKYAVVPTSPSSPKPLLNLLLGLILGFGLGIGIGILRQIFDDSVKNEDQLDGISLLGAIGFDPQAEEKPLVHSINPFSTRAESFRQLRTNLEFLSADNPPQVISVASALPGEGKTTTVLNLAITFAQATYKVLCLEADLRRPSTSKFLKYDESSVGLTEILRGELKQKGKKGIMSAIRFDEETGIHFLTSGKQAPNPAELLESKSFAQLIKTLRAEFDYILIDSPPLLPVTDGVLVAKKSDGVLLIVKAGETKVEQFRGARDLLLKIEAKILGASLNMIPLNRNGESYGYRYGYSYGYQRNYGVYGAGDYGVALIKGQEDRPYAPRFKVRDVEAKKSSKREQRRLAKARALIKADESRVESVTKDLESSQSESDYISVRKFSIGLGEELDSKSFRKPLLENSRFAKALAESKESEK